MINLKTVYDLTGDVVYRACSACEFFAAPAATSVDSRGRTRATTAADGVCKRFASDDGSVFGDDIRNLTCDEARRVHGPCGPDGSGFRAKEGGKIDADRLAGLLGQPLGSVRIL